MQRGQLHIFLLEDLAYLGMQFSKQHACIDIFHYGVSHHEERGEQEVVPSCVQPCNGHLEYL